MLATERNVSARQDLLDRVSRARQQSDALFRLVRPDSIYQRPIPERHRIIFYVGHLEAFDWNLLHDSALGLKSFDPAFDRLFAFGIDPVGGGLPKDQPSDWPAVPVVQEYVNRLRSALDSAMLGQLESQNGRDGFSLDTLLNVAIEHRLMHLETLAYMLHQLPLRSKISQPDPSVTVTSAHTNRMMKIPAGTATLGLSPGNEIFGWDNEYESYSASVPEFEIDQFQVTNGQFLDFIRAGGYETRSFWNDEDWQWKTDQRIAHPVFWKSVGDGWLYRSMFDEIPLPLDWPVYVSQAEAAAYAAWAGKSLPTELEWQRAAYGTLEGKERKYPWGDSAPGPKFGNFDFERWNPTPVNAHPTGASAFGVQGMLGNGWEWTATVFAPLPGFKPFPFYPGYSADFFDAKHFVMKGGSSRTAACMLRPTFRNWFQPRYQYVYAGFRCVSR